VAETIGFMKRIEPDCVGASLGVRLYPETGIVEALETESPLEYALGLKRRYDGRADLLHPTFYLSPSWASARRPWSGN